MRTSCKIATTLLAASLAGTAFAQLKPDDYVLFRKGTMQGQRYYLTPIAQMAQGKLAYNKDEAVMRATRLRHMIEVHLDGFGPGSEGASNTRTTAAAFSDRAKLVDANKTALAAADDLVKAAQAGTVDALKPAVGAMAKQCDSCHESFRSR